nr:proprotein convertase P-domain-containing protein [Stenotrophomonas koreensis]
MRASWQTGGGGGGSSQTYTNGTDVTISDNTTVESAIAVSGRSGNALASTPVVVDIRHTYKGDLKVDVVGPSGTLYNIHNYTGTSTDNVQGTFNLNLSNEPKNGNWRLRVHDRAGGDTGYINSWSITF